MIFHLFTLLFVLLKLLDVIAWSWWLVIMPSILGIVFALLAMLLVVATAAFVAYIGSK